MAGEVILSMKRLQPITALPKPGVVVQRDDLGGTPEPPKGFARERSAGAGPIGCGKMTPPLPFAPSASSSAAGESRSKVPEKRNLSG
jgi:hypothetical protein